LTNWSETLYEGEAMAEPVIDPMTTFMYKDVKYKVNMGACDSGLIKLPTGEYLVVMSVGETYPPQIRELREAREGDGGPNALVYNAEFPVHAYFTFATRTFMVKVPETAVYFDGSLIRLPNGTLVVWGSPHDIMTPAMEDVVHKNDPRVASAGERIYPATEYLG
jgi:hypothetical protein